MEKINKRRIFFNVFIVNGVTILEKVLFFLINVIIARYLTAEHYGEYTTALGYATFFSVFTNIGINQTLIRALNLESDRSSQHLGNALFIKTALALSAYTIMSITLYFTNYNIATIYLIFLFGAVRIGNEYLLGFYALYEAEERFIVPAISISTFSLLFLVSTIGITELEGTYFHFAYARLIIVILLLSIIIFFTVKHYTISFEKASLPGFIKNAIPFTLVAIFGNVIQRVNIIIISLMKGTLYAGYYNNGIIFFQTLAFIPINLNKVLIPFLYKRKLYDDTDSFEFTYNILSKLMALISFYFLVIFFLFSSTIIPFFFGEKYNESISILMILSFGIPFIFNAAPMIITSLDRQRINTIYMGIAALINIILNFALIPSLGANGSALAIVIAYGFMFFASNIYVWQHTMVKTKTVIKLYLNIILISIMCYFIFTAFAHPLPWIYSILVISICYLVFSYIIIITRDDIKLLKRMLISTDK